MFCHLTKKKDTHTTSKQTDSYIVSPHCINMQGRSKSYVAHFIMPVQYIFVQSYVPFWTKFSFLIATSYTANPSPIFDGHLMLKKLIIFIKIKKT